MDGQLRQRSDKSEVATQLNQDDFLRLFLQSEREVLRYVMALVPRAADAQEIVQETAVALWKKVDEFDASQPFVAWACGFAANKAKEYLRKQGRWSSFLNDEVASLLITRREQLGSQLDQRIEPLRECLEQLPAQNRGLVQQYYFEQAAVDVISTRVGRSVDALYKSLQRIRASLMDCVNSKVAGMEATQ